MSETTVPVVLLSVLNLLYQPWVLILFLEKGLFYRACQTGLDVVPMPYLAIDDKPISKQVSFHVLAPTSPW